MLGIKRRTTTNICWLIAAIALILLPVSNGSAQSQRDGRTLLNYRYFPETQYVVRGRFLQYCQTHGRLAQQGYPISDEFTEDRTDGKRYVVQYFERSVFEYHPENRAPNNVQLSLIGAFTRDLRYSDLSSFKDSDGDGIRDNKDACPYVSER